MSEVRDALDQTVRELMAERFGTPAMLARERARRNDYYAQMQRLRALRAAVEAGTEDPDEEE